MIQVYLHASEVLTGKGLKDKDGRNPKDEDMGRIPDGAVVFSTRQVGEATVPDEILWVGRSGNLPAQYSKAQKTDLRGKYSLIPGLVDAHTHLIFAGNRSEEFALRCAGATYEEIASQGGGILTTVEATRKAGLNELVALGAERVREAYGYGVRTLEAKSGYGLDIETELKQLRAVALLKKQFPQMTFVSTFLGAHAIPKDGSRETYIQEILKEMLPAVARERLAECCDVFVDEGYFTVEEARAILTESRRHGLEAKIHADELKNTGATELAVDLEALSADHLLKVSEAGIKKLASSKKTVGVLLPGTAFYLKAPYAPARKLIDSGACIALATDFNPGSSMTLSLPAIMTLSALYMGMTRAEIFAGVTYNAAKSLGLHQKKGCLLKGYDADFIILPFQKFEEVYYRFAWTPPQSKGR